jgi:hypothetical protein
MSKCELRIAEEVRILKYEGRIRMKRELEGNDEMNAEIPNEKDDSSLGFVPRNFDIPT